MRDPVPQFPSSQRTAYQFPVYRWIGWLAVAGFAVGLTVMFFISDLFGIPAPLGWAALVIIFTTGALLMDRPKLLLNCMLFYFLLMPSNRLFGLVGLPLPDFLDELFFLPFIAVIVMNWIQRRQLKEATLYPLVYCLIAGMSWYVNGKPSIFTAAQVTLVTLKPYIIWYYCRLTCTFEDDREFSRWAWVYIVFALVQYFYSVLWQRGLWPRYHPDVSGGVFGPDGGSAHIVGYLSVYALLLLAGWWVSRGRHLRTRMRWATFLVAVIISYNLIFMTDTKHALLLFPFAALPFLVHPKFPMQVRIHLLIGFAVFILFSSVYFNLVGGGASMHRIKNSLRESPKGEMLLAVTTDFPHLVPYPLLGAGPGRFASNQAVAGRVPLARRYIIPHLDRQRRMGYFRASGSLLTSSVLGYPQTDLFVAMGEFGWLGALAQYWFLGWVIVKLWRKSAVLSMDQLASGYYMGLCCCMVFLVFTTILMTTATIAALSFPLWILIGRSWDMRVGKQELPAA